MFSERIRQIREVFNLSQSDFAKKINISQSAVSEFENNTREPSKAFIIAVQKLGVSIDWFFSGEGNIFIKTAEDNKAKSCPVEVQSVHADKATSCPINLQTTLSDTVQELALESTAPKFAELEEKIDGKLGNLQSQINELKEAIAKKNSTEKYAEEVKEASPLYTADVPYEEPEETAELPLAENLAAGLPIEAFTTGETFPVPVRFLKKRKKYCVAKIKGTSMTEAGIADGAYVLLEINETPVNGSIVLVRYGNRTTLKRLREKEAGGWELCYEDGSGAVIPLKDGEWEVIGWFVRVVN